MTATAALARCVMRGCPVRYRGGGGDRPCPMHADEDYRLTARAAELGVVMAEPPGDRDAGPAAPTINRDGVRVR